MTSLELPRTAADVTPAWLTHALQAEFPEVEVVALASVDLHDGTALTSRLAVEYAPGPAGPPTVCLKAGLDGAHREFIFQSGLFSKEAMVYRHLLPTTAARHPRCFAAEFGAEQGRGFTLLEDLDARGAAFCGAEAPLTVEETASGLEQLAALHASRWGHPELEDPRWRHRRRGLGEADPLETYMLSKIPEAARRSHAQAVARRFLDTDVIGPAIARLRALDHAAAICLIHGDAHVGNFYREATGAIGMADYQCVQRGHYSHDVAMFIASSLDVLDRRANERALVEGHLRALERFGIDPPSFDEAWLGYRRHVLYGLWAWLLTTEQFQNQDRLVACVFRFGTAAVDLDALDAIGAP
jgi:hypothetical protein